VKNIGKACRMSVAVPIALAVLALILRLLACAVTDPLPAMAQRFTPPSVYGRWWSMTESCSTISASFNVVEWFVVPSAQLFPHEGQDVAGYYDPRHHRIVLAEAGQMDGALVRHEMLHAIIGGRGHPRSQFLGRCGGVVVCPETCIQDAGAPPIPGAALRRVPPESLQVAVQVDPAQPSASRDQGYFDTIVNAINHSPDSVVVMLPPASDAGPPVAFRFDWQYKLGGLMYDDRALDAQVTIFAPGEVKQRVFDLRVGAPGGVLAGSDSVRGWYGSQSTTTLHVIVSN
jgi:hypothetical protein